MQKTKYIWMNNKLVPWNEAKIHVLTHTLHYGSGAFEGIRCYKTDKSPAIFRLREHVNRLFNSFSIFKVKIPYNRKEIEKAIIKTVKVNKLTGGYIRPIIFFGYGKMGLQNLQGCKVNVAIACWPWPAYLGEEPLKVKISSYIRIHPKSTQVNAKLCAHYLNSILASLEAKEAGYDEALLLDYKGHIAEGPGENVFIVKNNKLLTPKLGTVLPGITRDSIITIAKDLGYVAKERDITVKELLNADEALFCGTAAEVTPIGQVNNAVIGNGKTGIITKKLHDKYLEIVQGKDKKYSKWLTYMR